MRHVASTLFALAMSSLLAASCGGSSGEPSLGADDGGVADGTTADASSGSSSGSTSSSGAGDDATLGDDGSGSSSGSGSGSGSGSSSGSGSGGDAGTDAGTDAGMDATVDACAPATCSSLGANCGSVSDGCGGTLSCGTCPAGQTCGASTPNVCGCVPQTCAQQGFNCGAATDGCGNVMNCGSCATGEVCGAASPNQCGTSINCTGLCTQQQQCSGGGTTSVSGTVYAPNGTDPLPNTLVYVPNGGPAPTYGVQPFVDGVSVPHCSCGSDVSGSPLVSAVTDYKGNFTILNMPVGANIPLVIQNGRWRRMYTIPNVASCTNTPLPTSGTGQLRMPRTEAETSAVDNIPLMGFVTGSVDALECVLRKIGIADSQFSDPSGTGRVRMYLGGDSAGGAVYSSSTPDESQLWGSQTTINGYDMVYFACKGAQYDRTAAAQSTLINYANAGGRVFTTHYSYVWLYDDPPFSTTASWMVDQPPNFSSDPETGFIVTSFPEGQTLAQWLQYIGASTTLGQMSIQTLRDDFTGVNTATSQEWIYLNDPNYPPQKPMHYTFNTPVGAAPANQCGRVLFSDYHVEDAYTSGTTFPAECTSATMTPQEKLLEYTIFDLGSCVTPPVCVPRTCMQQNTQCGAVGDGCGNILQCGTCSSGQTCVGGTCGGTVCTPKTCAQQGFNCGMATDGCGNVINCGNCTNGQTCGGGGMPNVCGGRAG